MDIAFRNLLIAGLPDLSASRINWGEHPQGGPQPYIVLHLISLNEGHTMQGPDGLQKGRVQVDCYAPNFGDAFDLAGRVKTVLDFHRSGGFLGIFFDGMRLPREGGESKGGALYRASLDFLTHWRASHAN